MAKKSKRDDAGTSEPEVKRRRVERSKVETTKSPKPRDQQQPDEENQPEGNQSEGNQSGGCQPDNKVEMVNAPVSHQYHHHVGGGVGLLDTSTTFADFGSRYLDRRLTEAVVATLGLEYPTLVQATAIPLILQGKDIIARARTGSGKTLAYSLPMLQKILESLGGESTQPASPLQACVLVPTRELCEQVSRVCIQLCEFCHSQISVRHTTESTTSFSLASEIPPTIIVSTPRSLLHYLATKQASCSGKKRILWRNQVQAPKDLATIFKANLKMIVLDEADAMMSLGFQEDLDVLFKEVLGTRTLEHRYQAILCSATLNAGTDHLKALMLHKPAILKLEEGNSTGGSLFGLGGLVPNRLTELYLKCSWKDKYLVLYSLLKLRLVPMKCLIFTSTSEKAYALRLFLDRFSMRATVLCPSLPFASRMNIITSFDQSLFEVLIATDGFMEKEIADDHEDPDRENSENEEKGEDASDSEEEKRILEEKQNRQKFKNDRFYGVHRGLDLHGLNCVINYDMPGTEKAYVHRVGRTARAGGSGVALTLCSSTDANEVSLMDKIMASRPSLKNPSESSIQPLALNLKDIDCFRYRVEDVLKSVTPKAIVALRTQDLQREVLHSKKLKQHFEANPQDSEALKKAFRSLETSSIPRAHLQDIPVYLKPSISALTSMTAVESAVHQLQQQHEHEQQNAQKTTRKRKQRLDPLKDFVGRGARKKHRISDLLARNLAREPDYSTTAPENLPALSGRKLHKIQRREPLRKPERMPNYKRRRPFAPKKK